MKYTNSVLLLLMAAPSINGVIQHLDSSDVRSLRSHFVQFHAATDRSDNSPRPDIGNVPADQKLFASLPSYGFHEEYYLVETNGDIHEMVERIRNGEANIVKWYTVGIWEYTAVKIYKEYRDEKRKNAMLQGSTSNPDSGQHFFQSFSDGRWDS